MAFTTLGGKNVIRLLSRMESLTLYDWCQWELDVHNKKSICDNGFTTCKLLMALRECILLSASCSGH
jgi:hypothetical protein